MTAEYYEPEYTKLLDQEGRPFTGYLRTQQDGRGERHYCVINGLLTEKLRIEAYRPAVLELRDGKGVWLWRACVEFGNPLPLALRFE